MNTDSPLDFKIKSSLLTDLFNLVGILKEEPSKPSSNSYANLASFKEKPFLKQST